MVFIIKRGNSVAFCGSLQWSTAEVAPFISVCPSLVHVQLAMLCCVVLQKLYESTPYPTLRPAFCLSSFRHTNLSIYQNCRHWGQRGCLSYPVWYQFSLMASLVLASSLRYPLKTWGPRVHNSPFVFTGTILPWASTTFTCGDERRNILRDFALKDFGRHCFKLFSNRITGGLSNLPS